jgi:hypothetical protein
MAILVGCAFQCLEPPRTSPEVLKPHRAIKLDAKLLDACVGQYEFPPDNRAGPGSGVPFLFGVKWTIRRQGDQLMGQARVMNKSYAAFTIYPESETNFFVKTNSPEELTFIKNDKGEVTAVIFHYAGLPDSEGKKLQNE